MPFASILVSFGRPLASFRSGFFPLRVDVRCFHGNSSKNDTKMMQKITYRGENLRLQPFPPRAWSGTCRRHSDRRFGSLLSEGSAPGADLAPQDTPEDQIDQKRDPKKPNQSKKKLGTKSIKKTAQGKQTYRNNAPSLWRSDYDLKMICSHFRLIFNVSTWILPKMMPK